MAANLYARSIFGEDALANLSIERSTNQPDSTVTGHIRIRAKSQVSVVCEWDVFIVILHISLIHNQRLQQSTEVIKSDLWTNKPSLR